MISLVLVPTSMFVARSRRTSPKLPVESSLSQVPRWLTERLIMLMLIALTIAVMILAPLAEVSLAVPGTWSPTGPLNFGRYDHTATLLPNGKVLVVGGYYSGYHADVELYYRAIMGFSVTYSLNTARCNHTATLLPSGKVLVVGGEGEGGSILASAELYDPVSGWSATASMGTGRSIRPPCCPTARCW